MGNGTRIGGSSSPPQPATTNAGDTVTSTETSSSTAENKTIQEGPQVAAKTAGALRQQATEAKGQQNVMGNLKQMELHQKFAGSVPGIQGSNSPHALSNINVQRDKTQDGGEITRYPNGVTLEKSKDNSMTNLHPPPGGSTDTTKDGRIVVRDANKKEVATLDRDGTLHVHSKHGEYTETADGKVTFVNKEKGSPADLRKPGEIPSNKYEDYGISSDGKTLRFPNGIEFDTKTRKITVPSEYSGGFKEHGNALGQRTGTGPNGDLYKVEKDGLYIPTPNGTFKISAGDTVSFQPNMKP